MNAIDANTYMVLFHIGPMKFPVYGFLAVTGFLIATLFSYIEWRKKGFTNWDFRNMIFMGGLISLYGARWTYILFNPVSSFSDVHSTLDVFMVFISISTGRSILGSIIFLTLFLYFYPKYFSPEVQWENTFTIILPNFFIAQAIGRWGNFADHNVFGNAVDENQLWYLTPWLKENMYINLNGVVAFRQPIFLFESIADILAFIFLLSLKTTNKIKEGVLGAMYILLYGLIRLILEPMRDPEYQMLWGNINMSIITSLIMIVFGAGLSIYLQKYHIYHKVSV